MNRYYEDDEGAIHILDSSDDEEATASAAAEPAADAVAVEADVPAEDDAVEAGLEGENVNFGGDVQGDFSSSLFQGVPMDGNATASSSLDRRQPEDSITSALDRQVVSSQEVVTLADVVSGKASMPKWEEKENENERMLPPSSASSTKQRLLDAGSAAFSQMNCFKRVGDRLNSGDERKRVGAKAHKAPRPSCFPSKAAAAAVEDTTSPPEPSKPKPNSVKKFAYVPYDELPDYMKNPTNCDALAPMRNEPQFKTIQRISVEENRRHVPEENFAPTRHDTTFKFIGNFAPNTRKDNGQSIRTGLNSEGDYTEPFNQIILKVFKAVGGVGYDVPSLNAEAIFKRFSSTDNRMPL